MALVLADRVKETTTTTGTGTVTLLGASTGFQSFAAVGNANTTYYTITAQTGTEWEVGIGTYTSSGTTLSRTTVLSSSNGGSAVNFSAGTKDVFVTYPSSRSVYADGTTLTATNSSVLPIASGGTNSTATATAGGIGYGTGTAHAYTSAGSSGQVVTSAGAGAPTFTTATNANTASAIVQRDASGNFSAGTITAALTGNVTGNVTGSSGSTTGNAATATVLQTARTINGTSFNGSADITITANTTNTLTLGTYLTGTSFNGSAAVTAAVDATSANTASKVVARDASGNFSAGTITAALSGNATTATSATSATTATTATQVSNSLTLATSGTGLSGSASFNGASAQTFTVASNATNANTGSTIVARDASGNFSAGTITASLTGNASGSAATFTSTSQNSQFNSIGVGTAASGTAGEIRATNSVTAHYSDDRLKTKLGNITGALAKVKTLNGFYYEANETAQALGYKPKREVGVSAQSVQAVLPEVVVPAPIDEQYLTVQYEKLVPLLIEAIKELEAKVAALEAKG